MNITFTGAVNQCLAKYATFTGRARRAEYWYFFLFTELVYVSTDILKSSLQGVPLLERLAALLVFCVKLALWLPGLAAAARRLHDVDKSAWWLLLTVVPLVAVVALVVAVTILYGAVPSVSGLMMVAAMVTDALFNNVGHSWWLLLVVVPLVGWIITLVWLFKWLRRVGTRGGNRFGADPLGF